MRLSLSQNRLALVHDGDIDTHSPRCGVDPRDLRSDGEISTIDGIDYDGPSKAGLIRDHTARVTNPVDDDLQSNSGSEHSVRQNSR